MRIPSITHWDNFWEDFDALVSILKGGKVVSTKEREKGRNEQSIILRHISSNIYYK